MASGWHPRSSDDDEQKDEDMRRARARSLRKGPGNPAVGPTIVVDAPGKGLVEADHILRIGRESAWADLILEPAGISRQHLEIRAEGTGYLLHDLGSRNGTKVNGDDVGERGRFLRVT